MNSFMNTEWEQKPTASKRMVTMKPISIALTPSCTFRKHSEQNSPRNPSRDRFGFRSTQKWALALKREAVTLEA